MIIGAPFADLDDDLSYIGGMAFVVLGRASTSAVELAEVLQGSGGFAMLGFAQAQQAGSVVRGAGDVDGDGFDDVIVATRAPGTLDSQGVFVVHGKASTQRVELAEVAQGVGGFAMYGELPSHEAGRGLGAAGDFDGDGLADVLVGAPGFVWEESRAYLVYGKTSIEPIDLAALDGENGGFGIVSPTSSDNLGLDLGFARDVNGDGLEDLFVGAPYHDIGDGRVYVVFGEQ